MGAIASQDWSSQLSGNVGVASFGQYGVRSRSRKREANRETGSHEGGRQGGRSNGPVCRLNGDCMVWVVSSPVAPSDLENEGSGRHETKIKICVHPRTAGPLFPTHHPMLGAAVSIAVHLPSLKACYWDAMSQAVTMCGVRQWRSNGVHRPSRSNLPLLKHKQEQSVAGKAHNSTKTCPMLQGVCAGVCSHTPASTRIACPPKRSHSHGFLHYFK